MAPTPGQAHVRGVPDGLFVFAVNDQPLGGLPPEQVVAVERLNELACQPWPRFDLTSARRPRSRVDGRVPVAVRVDVGVAPLRAAQSPRRRSGWVVLDDKLYQSAIQRCPGPTSATIGENHSSALATKLYRFSRHNRRRSGQIRAQQVAGRHKRRRCGYGIFPGTHPMWRTRYAAAVALKASTCRMFATGETRASRRSSSRFSFAAEHRRRDAAENVGLLLAVEPKTSPAALGQTYVVVELVQKLDVGGVRLEAKHAHAEVVLFAAE